MQWKIVYTEVLTSAGAFWVSTLRLKLSVRVPANMLKKSLKKQYIVLKDVEFYRLQYSVVVSLISAHEPLPGFPWNVYCHRMLSLEPSIAWEFLKVWTVFWVDIRYQGNSQKYKYG
jgi:hypothetical protein